MKTFIDSADQEFILGQWRGARAKTWLFHVSFKRMAISLFRKGELEGIYIIAVGCEQISGPFHWANSNITLASAPPNEWGEIRRSVTDEQVGLMLFCSDIVIAQGLAAAVPDDPFDGFLSL